MTVAFKNWITDFRVILHKDLISTRRVKKYFASSLVPPIVLLIMFSSLYSISDPESYKLIVVDLDDSDYSTEFLDYLKNIHSEFGPWFLVTEVETEAEARELLEEYQYMGGVIIPAGFGQNITEGQKGTVDLIVQNVNWDYPKNYMQRLDEAVLSFNQDHSVSAGNVDGFNISVEKDYLIGEDGTDLSLFRGLVVGIVGFYGMIFGLLMGALNIAKEYDDNTMNEIINSPISKTAFIASKQMIGVLLGAIATSIIGTLLYILAGVDFKGGVGGYFVILLSFCLSTWIHANIGTLLGLRFKKVMPSIILAIVISMVLWFFCGGMAPPVMLGEFVFYISRVLPGAYWNEILFATTFFPSKTYLLPRLITLIFIALGTTIVSWVVISKRGFKNE